MFKVVNISKKLLKEFFRLWRFYGFLPAFYTLVWWLNFYVRTPVSFRLSKWALENKTKILTSYIEKDYPQIINKYKTQTINGSIPNEDFKIWVFWGQGRVHMPPVVNACWEQLNRNYDNAILLTSDNISQYLKLPDILRKRVENGTLAWAHFSDIIRNKILYEQGGLWLDATVWTTDSIPFEQLMHIPFYSANGLVKNTNRSICFWTSFNNNWSTWCLWSNNKFYPLYGFVGEMMATVASDGKIWPDYVFQDFLIYYALNHFKCVEHDFMAIKAIPCNSRNKLASLMNSRYDSDEYKQLCKDDFVFKLSFRSDWHTRTKDGETTFYGKLIGQL